MDRAVQISMVREPLELFSPKDRLVATSVESIMMGAGMAFEVIAKTLGKVLFQKRESEGKKKFLVTNWASLTHSEITSNLSVIEQLVAVDKPISDELYRFLSWTVERACHEAFIANREFTLQKQIVILDAFDAIMKSRSTPAALKQENDSYYCSNLVGTGRIEGTREQNIGFLQDAIIRTKQLLMSQNQAHPAQADNFPKSFRHCLNLKEESWPAPLDTYLKPYALVLVDIARGSV